jgi:hypothetical protein
MKQWAAAVILTGSLAMGASAAGKGPEIVVLDDKFSISVEAVSLGRLLRLLDQATGMTSKVPPELANRNISVRFSGLSFDDGVRKIFQGQPYDYVVIPGQGIIITAVSQTISGAESQPAPVVNPSGGVEQQQPFIDENQPVFAPPGQALPQPGMVPTPFPGAIPNGNPFNPQQQQPAVIQTPFGPIPNPRANQQLPPNGNAPVQQIPFGSPAVANPFGANTNPNGQNPLFGTPPPIFTNPGQPR